ncbi:MAG: hypothetical protein NTY19_06595 [Planctomycetota bacterium]|nr:hypothetical protein [Planctomycetota bacterium]
MTEILKEHHRTCFGGIFIAALVSWTLADANAQELVEMSQETLESPPPLAHRYAALEAQLLHLKEQIAKLDATIPKLEKQVDELTERTDLLIPRRSDESTKSPSKTPRKEVGYRRPIEQREKDLKTPVIFVCEENRVAIFDLDAANRELQEELRRKGRISLTPGKSVTFKLNAGDFVLSVTGIAVGNDITLRQEGSRTAGCPGEPIADLSKSDSKIRKYLKQIESQAASTVIQFIVYPDSYDAFREVRQVVWQGHFRVNWVPMSHGEKIVFGAGTGDVGYQGYGVGM